MSAARLLSWGNYPQFPQEGLPCHWREDLGARVAEARGPKGTTLPFGAGLSYGDSCLAASNRVIHMTTLDRFMAADWASGLLMAEAGLTLDQILSASIPRGWFLPVTPGTKHITIGGAVANDIHGKNHHRRGTFGRHVRRFGLFRTDRGRLTCSPEENRELFSATIGGLGLTGVIEWAEIQLLPIRASQVQVWTRRFDALDEFFAISAEVDEQHEFCVSWVDCAAQGKNAGRGVYMAGDFVEDGTLSVEDSRKFTVPFTSPVSLINRLSLRLFNEVYWRRAPQAGALTRMGYDPFFYPLDAIRKWNRIYGRKGFQQYQCVIPDANSRDGVHALLDAISTSGKGSFLAVLKRCGNVPSPGLLSFPQSGTTLALDFPHSASLERELFPRLDAIVREAGGRLYPAKDAHMSGSDFRRAYPNWRKVEELRDPALLSRFWKRVTE